MIILFYIVALGIIFFNFIFIKLIEKREIEKQLLNKKKSHSLVLNKIFYTLYNRSNGLEIVYYIDQKNKEAVINNNNILDTAENLKNNHTQVSCSYTTILNNQYCMNAYASILQEIIKP